MRIALLILSLACVPFATFSKPPKANAVVASATALHRVAETTVIEFLGRRFERKFQLAEDQLLRYEFFPAEETPQQWSEMTELQVYPVHPEANTPADAANRLILIFKQRYPQMQHAFFVEEATGSAIVDFLLPESTRKQPDKFFLEFNAFRFSRAPGQDRVIGFHYAKNIEGFSESRPRAEVVADIRSTRERVIDALVKVPAYSE